MLTKHCRKVLDTILSLPAHQRLNSFRILDLSEKIGLSFPETLCACKELDRDGLAELHIVYHRNGQQIPESIVLTEPGLNYKALLRAQRLAYIADKWVDILASIVAILASIPSLYSFIYSILAFSLAANP